MPTREERTETRRENLRRYCHIHLGGPPSKRSVMKALKEKTGDNGSYLNDLLKEGSTKSFGEDAVQRIEDRLGLVTGQLSEPGSKLLLDPRKIDNLKNRAHEEIEMLSSDECAKVLGFIASMRRRRASA